MYWGWNRSSEQCSATTFEVKASKYVNVELNHYLRVHNDYWAVAGDRTGLAAGVTGVGAGTPGAKARSNKAGFGATKKGAIKWPASRTLLGVCIVTLLIGALNNICPSSNAQYVFLLITRWFIKFDKPVVVYGENNAYEHGTFS